MTSYNDGLEISLLGTPAASGLARSLVRQRLDKWGFLRIADDALVVTSELVANAAKARPHEEIVLLCRREHRTVLIAVWDGSRLPPVPRPAFLPFTGRPDHQDHDQDGHDPDTGGHGLHIVRALAIEWGHRPEPADPVACRPAGKWVWARMLI